MKQVYNFAYCRFVRWWGHERITGRVRERGFSLVELMVTIALVAIMAIGMSGFLAHVFTLYSTQWDWAEAWDALAMALHRMDCTISRAEQVEFDGTTLSASIPAAWPVGQKSCVSNAHPRLCEFVVTNGLLLERMVFDGAAGRWSYERLLLASVLYPGLRAENIRLDVDTGCCDRIRLDLSLTATRRMRGKIKSQTIGESKWIPLYNAP